MTYWVKLVANNVLDTAGNTQVKWVRWSQWGPAERTCGTDPGTIVGLDANLTNSMLFSNNFSYPNGANLPINPTKLFFTPYSFHTVCDPAAWSCGGTQGSTNNWARSFTKCISGSPTLMVTPAGYTFEEPCCINSIFSGAKGKTSTADYVSASPGTTGTWTRMGFWIDGGALNQYDGTIYYENYKPSTGAVRWVGTNTFGDNNRLPDSIPTRYPYEGGFGTVIFEHFYNVGDADLWHDDHYVSIGTPNRVELCDEAAWDDCKTCNIQEAVSWTNSSITFLANFGNWSRVSKGGRKSAYLYVIGRDNRPIDSPILVSLDGPGPKHRRIDVPTVE